VAGADVGIGFELRQNAPNPFGSETAIRFSAPVSGAATLSVFDVSGRLVSRLVDGEVSAGRHVVRWNGRNREGRSVGDGVYFYRLQVGEREQVRRMVRLR
jgi:flagellar hook assembly protein FlgD